MIKKKTMAPKVPSFAFQGGNADFRAEVGQGVFCSCITINARGWKSPSGKGHKGEVNLSLSYHQAVVLAEILEGFTISRRCHRKAQLPVTVKWNGETQWSTFPYSY
jgi:hypothetical protein